MSSGTVCLSLSDIGLMLDMVAITLLAFFSVPTNTLTKDGGDSFSVGVSEIQVALNKAKYQRYRKITIGAYILLGIGFLMQLRIVQDLLL